MANKIIKKKDCKFEALHIVRKGKIVGIPRQVWLQLERLERIWQEYIYLRLQPKYQPGPSLDGFERESLKDIDLPYVKMKETPVSDRRFEEAMKFISEQEDIQNVEEINKNIQEFSALIHWAKDKKFIEGDCYNSIDTPYLGNPLELTDERIVNRIKIIVTHPIEMVE